MSHTKVAAFARHASRFGKGSQGRLETNVETAHQVTRNEERMGPDPLVRRSQGVETAT